MSTSRNIPQAPLNVQDLQVTKAAKEIVNPKILIGLLALIFLAAFALNFNALSHLAGEVIKADLFTCSSAKCSGSILPYLLPILIDIFLLLAVLTVLRNESLGENARLAWTIIVVATIGAVALNLLHYGAFPDNFNTNTIKAVAVSIIVPAAILLSSELIRGLLHSLTKRNNLITTTLDLSAYLDQLRARIKNKEVELSALKTKSTSTDQKLTSAEQELANTLKDLKAAKRGKIEPDKLFQEAYRVDGMRLAGMTWEAIGEQIGKSESAARKALERLSGTALSKGVRQ